MKYIVLQLPLIVAIHVTMWLCGVAFLRVCRMSVSIHDVILFSYKYSCFVTLLLEMVMNINCTGYLT